MLQNNKKTIYVVLNGSSARVKTRRQTTRTRTDDDDNVFEDRPRNFEHDEQNFPKKRFFFFFFWIS